MTIKLRDLIDAKKLARENWITARKTERDKLHTLSEDGIFMVTESPSVYLKYLEIQALNPYYSASNVILAMQQGKDISILGSEERFKKIGRLIKKNSEGMKIRVTEAYQRNGQEHTGFKIGTVYDISQTSGRPFQKIELQEGSPQIESAVEVLVQMAPVYLEEVDKEAMDLPSFYDPDCTTIFIQHDLSDQETFTAITKEIVHAWIHNRGAYCDYSRTDCELDASSVAYMLSLRYGIPAPSPDTTLLHSQYDGLDTQDRRQLLDFLQQTLKRLDNKIERELSPRDRDRQQTKREQPVR